MVRKTRTMVLALGTDSLTESTSNLDVLSRMAGPPFATPG